MTDLTIQGAVQSCQGVFITGATVTLEGTGQSATTGGDGRYRIGPLANFLGGDYVLTASAAGYSPRSLPLTLPDTGVRTVNFAGASCLSSGPVSTPTATSLPAILFADDVERGNRNWLRQHSGGNTDWEIVDHDAESQPHSWYAVSSSAATDMYLISAPMTLGPNIVLAFWHRYILEANRDAAALGYDGGVVELSNDGGTTWQDLGLLMTQNGYNTVISSGFGSPIPGRRAFSNDSRGWLQTRVELSSFYSQTVLLRFRLANDSSDVWDGWWIDDVTVGRSDTVVLPTPHPTVALTWAIAASVTTARFAIGAVASNGKVYASGGSITGWDGGITNFERYDPGTNSWTPLPPMLHPRYQHTLVEISGKLMAVGGYVNFTSQPVEEYDPVTNVWSVRADGPAPRDDYGVATAGGKIYAIGGYLRVTRVDEFNPATNTWSQKASMPTGRDRLAAVTGSNGKIYIIGGW
ncbi:MAG: carboxypeptidase regulatory-like domain-containing protein, partial [Anaerolineae bacterium]|nr:carboxypeptidase regulatory-like domain-containing protein [Anaerolineae bacterium]